MGKPGNTIHIGLCMAGAISAGAYTAGVVDYLIEALEEWQKRKSDGTPDTPSHHVEISVIGGASAGGMTSIVTAAALQESISKVVPASEITYNSQSGNTFYHSWVDLVNDDMFSELMSTSDIQNKKVPSLLNSEFIDGVAERALSLQESPAVDRPYIADDLKVFVSLTNLKGMKFGVDFDSISKQNRYIVTNHKDYACLKFCKNESTTKDDGWIPVDMKSGMNVQLAKDAAMATGAFPIGLQARKIIRDGAYLNKNPWFDYITKGAGKPFMGEYESLCIDGGMINNEPFEKVRMLLDEQVHSNPLKTSSADVDANEFRSTVIMIDPFPSEDKDEISDEDSADHLFDLPTVAAQTITALKNQSRVKPIDLKDALDPDKMGQFLVAPVRYEKDSPDKNPKSIEGKHAIACGSLGGFGGFLKKDFRIHDFYLGRANCEKFLRDYFIVPTHKQSKILDDGYAGVSDTELDTFTSFDVDGIPRGMQIIPLFTKQAPKPDLPEFENGTNWPSISPKELAKKRNHISRRVYNIAKSYFQSKSILKPIENLGIRYLSNRIAKIIVKQITKSIRRHKLMAKS